MSGEEVFTQQLFTLMWKDGGPCLIPHLKHQGMMLTPRIETEKAGEGYRIPREIMGLPICETMPDGRIVYALPGGLSHIDHASH